ncbi:MAG: hypothetical protein L6R42_000967 [Xanthoria sp. 1 TBL-2021]|nr:MAG: hypothetical protein L6R42_000967 [Xanthoria sp. 1 TBL-2021]
MALAPLLGESLSGLARRNIQILRRENNHPEIIGVRIARDVAATMDVWREPPATSGMTTEQLRTMIAINIEDDRANIEENRQFWEDFRATPASLRTQLPPTLAPLPQPLVNGWPNGPATVDAGSQGVGPSEVRLPVVLVVDLVVPSTLPNPANPPNSATGTCPTKTSLTASSPETHDDVEEEDAHVTVGFDTRFDLCSIYSDGYGFFNYLTDGTSHSGGYDYFR